MRYPRSERRALDGLSLTVAQGSFFGLLGPNGAGKTTLLSFLCGQIEGQYKSAKILGHDRCDISSYKQNLGYAPQEIALYPALSGRANLEFFAGLLGRGTREVESVLDWVGLTARASDPVREYSGGMKRRLNLAVAVLHRPKLLILDEPTVGVDPQSRLFIFEKLLELKKDGVTLIYSTHYLEEIKRLCDSVAVIFAGKLLAQGPLQEVLGHELEARYLELTGREVE